MSTKSKIIQDFYKIGIKKGDRLFIHSSFKSMGSEIDGPLTFIEALKEAVGDEGTIMFPTFSYDIITKENPVFDILYTKSNVGIIPEIARQCDGFKRSLNPTHSVTAWGKDRDFYIKDHCKDNVCVGENSPLYKLKDTDGKILMVGCGITHNTLIHGVETYVKPPYAFKVDYNDLKYKSVYTLIDEERKVTRKEIKRIYGEAVGWAQDYGKLQNLMTFNEGYILEAKSYIMDAKKVWNVVKDKMIEDPYYFVKKIE